MVKQVLSFLIISSFFIPSLGFANERLISKMVHPVVRVQGASGTVVKSWNLKSEHWCYVLTAKHVTDNAKDKTKIPADFAEFDNRGKITKNNEILGFLVEDSADFDFSIVLYNTPKLWPTVKLIPPLEAKNFGLFDTVYVVGSPNYQRIWATRGIISSFDLDPRITRLIGHDAKIYFGNSGGPLYNAQGFQIGINLRVSMGFNGDIISHISFSLPMFYIYDRLGPDKYKQYFQKV